MGTHIHRKMDSEDQETLFHSYPCSYYVQSPSTISHANSSDLNKTHVHLNLDSSPTRSDSNLLLLNNKINPHHEVVSTFTLSRYSSSRGSNNSNFLDHNNNKVIDGDDDTGIKRLIIVDGLEEEEEEEDEDDYYGRKGGFWWRYCTFRKSSSLGWICFQLCWRFVFSLGIALLVFYIATKPPPPTISIKMGGIREFGLGEGVDGSGVTTKILTTNCSIDLLVENNSSLFGLHIRPPILEMFFAHLPFAISRGTKLYAESHSRRLFELNVGTKNKAMYGAGRSMEDLLESGNGLPLLIRLRFTSHFRVISGLIQPEYHHHAQCLLFLHRKYDQIRRTQAFNSTCTIS